MGKRFAIVIGVAAAGVLALGAQTAAAAPKVVKYDTKLTLSKDGGADYHGRVRSDRDRNPTYDPATAVRRCMEGRRVILFKKRPGADRRLGASEAGSCLAHTRRATGGCGSAETTAVACVPR